MLYENWDGEGEGAFSDKRLTTFAEILGSNIDEFNSCFEANKYKDQIDADIQAGNAIGVSGTPSVFVNNKSVTPGLVPTYDQLVQAIEEALAGE
jgi:protein-disulfide isomerase